MTLADTGRDGSGKKLMHLSIPVRLDRSTITLWKAGRFGTVAMPWIKLRVIVPWDAQVEDCTVTEVKTTLLAKGLTVEPCQPWQPAPPGARYQWVPPDTSLYASSAAWPAAMARFAGIRRSGGFALAEVNLCPFRYRPGMFSLELAERLDIILVYRRTDGKPDKPRSFTELASERKLAERIRGMVLNPEDVDVHRFFKDGIEVLDYTTYPAVDYVIVTSDALAEPFRHLATWRTRLGLNARVVTVEEISAGSVADTGNACFRLTSGYHDGGTRDDAEAIRNFIKWARVNWSTDFVLLGGDTSVIPTRHAAVTGLGFDGDMPAVAGALDYGQNVVRYRDIATPDLSVQHATSATASTTLPGSLPAAVLDGNESSFWQCGTSDATPWIQLSLHAHAPVNCVKLGWGATFATSYAILVSTDGVTWTEKYSTTSGTGGTEEIRFECTSATALRILVTSGPQFALAEVGVHGPARGAYHGAAYRIDDTSTRLYLTQNLLNQVAPPDPNLPVEQNIKQGKSYLLIIAGDAEGTLVPFDETCSAARLGWRFIADLADVPATPSPTRTTFIELCGPVMFHGQPFLFLTDGNYMPTDLYYADIAADQYVPAGHHDWDADCNGIYGERYSRATDRVNQFPDIFVGRLPVREPAEVAALVAKITRYERFQDPEGFELPADFGVSILLGSENLGAVDDPVHPLDRSAVVSEQIRQNFLDSAASTGQAQAAPSRWLFTRRYQDYLRVQAQGPDLAEGTRDAIVDAIEGGNNAISLISHGNTDYLCFINDSGILKNMLNNPGICFSYACHTARFDLDSGQSIGECAVLNPLGGMVAYMGHSRMGSTGDGPLACTFWQAMPSAERLGEMADATKTLLPVSWVGQIYDYNLFGDPALRVWSDRPLHLDVSCASTICTGHQSYSVSVTSGGRPVPDALVCLTMEGSLFTTCRTTASGKASPMITPSVEGTMHLTVSGKNLIPYLGTVRVKKCDHVVCTSNIICDHNLLTCTSRLSFNCKRELAAYCVSLNVCPSVSSGCPAIDPGEPGIDDLLEPLDRICEIWGGSGPWPVCAHGRRSGRNGADRTAPAPYPQTHPTHARADQEGSQR